MLQIIAGEERERARSRKVKTSRLFLEFGLRELPEDTGKRLLSAGAELTALLKVGSRLTFTHCLRPGGRYRLRVILERTARTPLAVEQFEYLIEASLPGFARLSQGGKALRSGWHHLGTPALSPLQAVFPAAPPGPSLHQDRTAGLLLPAVGRQMPDLESALAFLIRQGRACDLVLQLAPWPLSASEMRALHETREALHMGGYTVEKAMYNPHLAARLAQRIEQWLTAPSHGFRLQWGLHLDGAPDPNLAAVCASCLHGVASIGMLATGNDATLDFSSRLGPGSHVPPLVPRSEHFMQELRHAAAVPLLRPADGKDLCIGLGEGGVAVEVEAAALRQHLYVIGGTGTGKSTLLQNMIGQDIHAGRGVFVIDPHGDLHEALLQDMPATHRDRLIIADAGDFDDPFSLNILETQPGPHSAIQRNFIANQLISLFKLVYGHNQEAFGPMFEMYFRAALLLLMDAGDIRANLSDMNRLFGDPAFRNDLLERCSDPSVVSVWKNIAVPASGEASLENIAPYIVSKLTRIEGNPLLRPILCSGKTTLDIPAALSEGMVVLVNLAKGQVGGSDAAMLGGIITIRLFAAAMARAAYPPQERRLIRVYLDEFQTHALDVLGDMLSESRKFGLSLVLANQSLAQLDQRTDGIAQAILANAANFMAFRAGPDDAALISDWLGTGIAPQMLTELPNYRLIARLLTNGRPAPPTLVNTLGHIPINGIPLAETL